MSIEREITTIIKNDIIPNIQYPFNLVSLKDQISRMTSKEKMDFVRTHLENEEILKKIRTYISNSGGDFTIKEIQEEITNNDYFCLWFIKDTSKQNVYEHLQFQILKYKLSKDIEKLSSSGKNCKFVNESKITNKTGDITKSIDFVERYKNFIIYYFAKFTKDTIGGAQDNQANDGITFIKESYKYSIDNNDNIRFVFLGDGDYYQGYKFQNTIQPYLNNKVKFHTINTIQNEKWD